MVSSDLLLRFAIAASLGTAAAFESGCLAKGLRFTDPLGGRTTADTIVGSATSCADACNGNSDCKGFSYWPHDGECWFSQSGSAANMATSEDSYVGWPTNLCPSPPPACAAVVKEGSQWPATTEQGSMSAFDIGYQPASLQCWPMEASKNLPKSCPEVTTLDDTANGWPGKCEGLDPITVLGNTTCEAMCLADVNCPGYQVGSDDSCWHGVGMGCWSNVTWNKTWTPVSAKRYQRGSVRTVKDISNVEVKGLTEVFNQQNAARMPDAAQQCRHTCISVLGCQYWQLVDSACWIELPPNRVAYPLTTANAPPPDVSVVGEFIQHVCFDTVTTTTTIGESGLPWWGWFLIALACMCCLCCLVGALLYMLCGKSKKTTSRGLRAEEEVPVIPAQPVDTQMSQMPMYRSAPVAQAGYYPAGQPQYNPSSYQQPLYQSQMPMQQMSAFDMIDRNGDGVITREEYMRATGQR